MNASSTKVMARGDLCCRGSGVVPPLSAARPRAAAVTVAVTATRLLPSPSSTWTAPSSRAFAAFPLAAHRFPVTQHPRLSQGFAAIKSRTIVAVASPQSSSDSPLSSPPPKVNFSFFFSILVAFFFSTPRSLSLGLALALSIALFLLQSSSTKRETQCSQK